MSVNRRVIVTGSRDWPTPHQIWDELDALAAMLTSADTMTVVHGDARGADRAAQVWWERTCETPSIAAAERTPWAPGQGEIMVVNPTIRWRGNGPTVSVERHPADWDNCTPECRLPMRQRRDGTWYCPEAGPRRNAQMIAAGADFLLAFPLTDRRTDSPGTWNCLGLAAAARIPYRRIYPRR